MTAVTLALTAVTITLSSTLLFIVQPLVARQLLPAFGGSPMVWATTMLFFQVVLLCGYLYAHWLASWTGGKTRRLVHLSVLAGSVLFLPLSLELPPPEDLTASPSLSLLLTLAVSLLVPASLLSSTNPLVQAWLVMSDEFGGTNRTRRNVYRWFSLSNVGSLGGLLAYPFLIEPWMTLTAQRWWWSVGFVVFVLINAWLAQRLGGAEGVVYEHSPEPHSKSRVWLWGLLAAAGSWLYLATTNQITRNVAPVPFLWVVPLSLYLLSFILCFERDGWYRRALWLPVSAVSTIGSCYLLRQTIDSDYVVQLAVYLTALFSGTMILHGELSRLRPLRRVTGFYLSVAVGGALGGVGVSLVAPALFADYWEYPIAFLLLVIGFGLAYGKGREHSRIEGDERVWDRRLLVGTLLAMVGFVIFHIDAQTSRTTLVRRNFFGVLRVYDGFVGTEQWRRDLWNGGIGHGGEFLSPSRRLEPTMYFGPEAGIGVALTHLGGDSHGEPRRVAVLGLGVGTLACYGRPGDEFIFYELNPDVAELAKHSFYYLSESEARTEVRIGDGRQTLQEELLGGDSTLYDAIVMDAFTGDAIPVHLITREAFALYRSRLKPGGILAVNISNIHFDLRPVLRAQAEALGSIALLFSDNGNGDYLLPSDWVVISDNAEFVAQPEVLSRVTPWTTLDERGQPSLEPELGAFLWTDDYSDVFRVLRERW